MNEEEYDNKFWAEIGRIIMYEDDWSGIVDPVAVEMACQDVLEVEVDRSGCEEARAMLSSIGIKA